MNNQFNRKLVRAAETENLERSLYSAEYMIKKSYLTDLLNMSILPTFNIEQINFSAEVRLFRLERLVQNNKQSVLESLVAIYTALGKAGHSIFFILEGNGDTTQIYIGVKSKSGDFEGQNAGDLLKSTFDGQFSGSKLTGVLNTELKEIFQTTVNHEKNDCSGVTAVTLIPSLSVDNRENFIQGMERFIDAAEGKIYQAIFLAEAVEEAVLHTIRRGYEQIYTQISPFSKNTFSYSTQESENIAHVLGSSVTETLGKSIALTETKGTSISNGVNESSQQGSSTSQNKGGAVAGVGAGIGMGVGAAIAGPSGVLIGGAVGGAVGGLAGSLLGSDSQSSSQTKGTSYTESENLSEGKTSTNTSSTANTSTKSTSKGATYGTSQQSTIEFQNKSVQQILNKIDQNLARLDDVESYGGWNFAAYFIGETPTVSHALGSIYYGLMKGDDSNSEASTITTWTSEDKSLILKYLKNLQHPQLKVSKQLNVQVPFLSPTSLLSTKEIALTLNLPHHSTSSVSVVETVPFGRSIQYLNDLKTFHDNAIDLGVLRHLWKDSNQPVYLENKQLTQHTLVCGSTGSGKSNTLYTILKKLRQQQIPFLVIEPVKGEYKHVFGNYSDVFVYGTNPKHTDLLKLNPFSFPEDIHVLEHVDRLVEIFNVCWPMYAAMPIVLKKAILLAYQRVGWNLDVSENIQTQQIFPTFTDVALTLKEIIENSAYSEEVKGNYIGSLETRIMSLTDGLNAQLFTSNEIDNSILFDQNVIVDLSRVASSETKSLIMGILVMKLNEYRISQNLDMNSDLRHVTILEEAHHLLKRTSTSQSMESSNLVGKSVEMLSDSIAEMRTYGQGFILVDQSPNALDISAIKNTNTKIILRLPEEQDRQVVGSSVSLKDEQLAEISKLPQGVAIVHQSHWLEPILCKINYFQPDHSKFYFKRLIGKAVIIKQIEQEILLFLLCIGERLPSNYQQPNLDFLLENLVMISDTVMRIELEQLLQAYKDNKLKLNIKDFAKISRYIVRILNLENKLEPLLKKSVDIIDFDEQLNRLIFNEDFIIKNQIKQACLKYLTSIDCGYLKAYQTWVEHVNKQNVA
ncbi:MULTISPECIES: ATP-binding protein [Acinetobacter]|uniref:ATP-binding protein n=1 Tax=Acinetobacter piscicola TaxID=2006115 RepID=A0A7S7AHH4_9GAMM|nr:MULTISPECIES: ATP-binding protein [Acinetobacter]QOW45979.1 ATP-binding protein [Acinetobacter piscicola]